MAQQNQNFPTVPDASTKLEDKSEVTDCNADSGFISSENIIYYSGDIREDNVPQPTSTRANQSENQKLHSVETLDSGIISDKEPSMHLDSGICEVLKIEDLSIGNEKLNNLNQPTRSTKYPAVAQQKQTLAKTNAIDKKRIQDIRFKYFEQDEEGDTTLHSAILVGHVELSSALIRIAPHPKFLDIANDDAQTPLHLAVETQQLQIVRQLIVAGAHPCLRDIRGDSPLHIAARHGNINCVKAILVGVKPQELHSFSLRHAPQIYEKKNLDQWNYLGQTPVHVAAIHGHIDVVRHLVEYGADINAREGLDGFTPLHYAVQRRDEQMVCYLLKECLTISPNTKSYAGRTAWQTCPIVSDKLQTLFKTRGIESPYTSEEEDISSEEDEEMYSAAKPPTFVASLVSSSA